MSEHIMPIISRFPFAELDCYREAAAGYSFCDHTSGQLEELFRIWVLASGNKLGDNLFEEFLSTQFNRPVEELGCWVVYPWLRQAHRIVDEADFYFLRTNRNQNLITTEEQSIFGNAVVAVAGLSVGSNVALSLVLTGGANHIRVGDLDTFALSNLNRVSFGVPCLGLNKAVAAARRLYEINPYADIEIFEDGITEDNIDRFLRPPVAVVFDEMDDVRLKIIMRLKAREAKLPIVSIADNGDNIIVDIERFDLGVTEIYHGRLSDQEASEFLKVEKPDRLQLLGMILKILGVDSAVPRMQDSLLEVGKSLVSWPQLGTAATLAGTTGAYIARKIILGESVAQGRIHVSLDGALVPGYNSPEQVKARQKHTEEVAANFSTVLK